MMRELLPDAEKVAAPPFFSLLAQARRSRR